ncbi:aminotransferase class V-fold PLP-dependent enzyme [Viridibacillus sp. YIM B01967]|uniref:Aminotransferase class V-fold PLP-dependent enzyme n=1 Tax=Viridibacillus soli TaxID=2798301 RepID=A0ABS1H6I6_9BACL|nr:aminotransferase class V-fold PLP-dependent enzyme [Viridibacillus soli]MBK3494757.1 aminotransferase class V-fold PLP-dependent enzyme [Viridibacillus soli]
MRRVLKKLTHLIRPNTTMVIINHGSNVTGELIYKQGYGGIAHKYKLFMFVDSSQAIGNVEISVETDNIDIMAFSCHKSLLGFTGVGALYFNNDIKINQIITGGTGIRSESDEIDLLEESDYETGTINMPGLLSLNYSLEFIENNQ